LATGVTYDISISPSGPISDSEVNRFVAMLDSDDWFSRLVATVDPTRPGNGFQSS
jgi:hypothetical protein